MNIKNDNHPKYIDIVKTKIESERTSNSKSFVLPGHLHAHPGDKVNFKAVNIGVEIIFPKRELFGQRELTLRKGNDETLTVITKDSGSYPYVVITEDGDLAIGGSFPVFIIE